MTVLTLIQALWPQLGTSGHGGDMYIGGSYDFSRMSSWQRLLTCVRSYRRAEPPTTTHTPAPRTCRSRRQQGQREVAWLRTSSQVLRAVPCAATYSKSTPTRPKPPNVHEEHRKVAPAPRRARQARDGTADSRPSEARRARGLLRREGVVAVAASSGTESSSHAAKRKLHFLF